MRTEEEIIADIERWANNSVMVKNFKRELGELVNQKKPKKKKIEEVPKIKAKIYTKDEAKHLNKASQIEILEGYGIEGKGIPKKEDDRVKLILKLQKK